MEKSQYYQKLITVLQQRLAAHQDARSLLGTRDFHYRCFPLPAGYSFARLQLIAGVPVYSLFQKILSIVFVFFPVLVYPIFTQMINQRVLLPYYRDFARIRLSPEVPYLLIAVLVVVILQFLFTLFLPKVGSWTEASIVGALLAAPAYGVIRGFAFDINDALLAGIIIWLFFIIAVLYPGFRRLFSL